MSALRQLPRWAAEIVHNPPKSGQGFHPWLLRASLALMRCQWDQNDISDLLRIAAATCGRAVPAVEISSAILTAKHSITGPAIQGTSVSSPKWPEQNHELIEAICENKGGLADLWEASPARFDDNESHVEEVINILFPGDPLLCCGLTSYDFSTQLRSEWQGHLAQLQFIVPSPMSTRRGLTRDGKDSAHTLSNTGPRRFLVIEFDTGSIDGHAAKLFHLGERAPLALAVHSGGKSLHGWFFCQNQPEDRLLRFMQYAVSLGADRATWTRSQFVRMPGGTRDNRVNQVIYFFNPKTINE